MVGTPSTRPNCVSQRSRRLLLLWAAVACLQHTRCSRRKLRSNVQLLRRCPEVRKTALDPASLLHCADVQHCSTAVNTHAHTQHLVRARVPVGAQPGCHQDRLGANCWQLCACKDCMWWVLLLLVLLHHAPLLPRMKTSPYLFFSCPLTYSCRGARTERVSILPSVRISCGLDRARMP